MTQPIDIPDDLARLLKQADAAREHGDSATALSLYRQALIVDPENLYAFYWLGAVCQEQGDLAAAKNWCERGLAIDPDQIGILLRLGSVAVAELDSHLALQCYERVAKLAPEAKDIDAMLADQYCRLGRLDEGIAAFERALANQPDSINLQSNRLLVLNYTNMLTQAELFEEHRRWGALHETRLYTRPATHSRYRRENKRLRVAYVSSDFRDHPVATFVEPLLREHDKAAFEIICWDTSKFAEDKVTARLKNHVHAWHRVGDLNDDALAEAIVSSEVDILFDLSGHTSGHRLLMFARKPAPVQVTWLGYLNTTGLTTIDYRITDDYMDPEGTTERFHTETLFRLPNFCCFGYPVESPQVSPLPASTSDVFTFGSINQWWKVTEEAKDMWATLLVSTPRSRIIVVARGASNPAFRERIVSDFARRGVSANQVVVSPSLPLKQFLELFAKVDVTLDTFPYGGGTTTMFSLWMGVPVVALAGRGAVARNAIGPLSELGLVNLIATSPQNYLEIARGLAQNIPWLTAVRAGLRERMTASAIVDAKRFAVNMESAIRVMWRNYCSNSKTTLRIK